MFIVQVHPAAIHKGMGRIVSSHVQGIPCGQEEGGAFAHFEATIPAVDAQNAGSIQGQGLKGPQGIQSKTNSVTGLVR